MVNRSVAEMQKVAMKMAGLGRTERRSIRRPRWKEYTLIKTEDKKEISREKVWINEAEIFPSDEDFFWEPNEEMVMKPVA